MTRRHDDNADAAPRGAGAPPGGLGAPGHDDTPIAPELVDRFFDNELDEQARREFLRALPRDLETCQEVAQTRRMLDMLRAGTPGGSASGAGGPLALPDLTGRIIARVDSQRGFASRHVRRIARVARLAIAASLVLVVGAIAAVERVAPDATRLAPAPAPLTTAFRQTEAEVTQNLGSLASTLDTIQQRVVRLAPVAPRAQEPHRGGRPGAVVSIGLDLGRPEAPVARTMAVGFRMAPKGAAAVWTLDMAPGAHPQGELAADVGAAPGSPRAAIVARFIDAEGRCSAVVMPLGIERVGREDLAASPFVLPGRDVAAPARPAEWMLRSGSRLP